MQRFVESLPQSGDKQKFSNDKNITSFVGCLKMYIDVHVYIYMDSFNNPMYIERIVEIEIVQRRHSFSKLDGNPPLRLKQQSNSATEGEKDM